MRRPNRSVIVNLCAACLLVACAPASPARAQEEGEQQRQGTPVVAARKVSEYVNQFNSCNAGAYLDNFAVELQHDEQAEGYIIGYAPGGVEGTYGRRLLEITKDYLVNHRGLEESRIKLVNGGRYKNQLEAATELWLVPPGAAPPPLIEYRDEQKTFEGKFAEYVGWEGYGGGEVMSWSSENELALAAFADHARRQPEAVAYVVAYNLSESVIGTWRRIADAEARALETEGVGRERVKIIFGGKMKGEKEAEGGAGAARVQLWLLPRDAPPPVREARKERRPKESQQLAAIPQYVLGSDDEQRALKGLADVLREDENLRAFLVVKLPSGDAAALLPEESPPVDMSGLAEKWRKELKAKYGVNENRVVVLTVPPREELSFGELETWVVPPGAAPPDPYASDESEEEGEEPVEEKQKEF